MTGPKPDSGAWSAGVHRLAVRVYYEDTDFTGAVYYANYLKFLERGRTDYLRCAGVGHAELAAADPPLGFAVREARIKYVRPARIDDALTIETRLSGMTGARLTMDQRVLRGAYTLVEAVIEAVCIDFAGRPRRLPATLRDRMAPG